MIAAFLFASRLREFLTEKTELYQRIFTLYQNKLSLSPDTSGDSASSLPLILGRSFNTAAEDTSRLLADKLTGLTMTVLCFILILLAVKFVLFLLTLALSKRENKGFAGFVDGVLGLIAGMIKGIIFVFLFLALLLPAINLISPASTQLVLGSLESSSFARTLYDSNFIVLILNDFMK